MQGAGTSGAPDDVSIPFLTLLQDNSPEAKKRESVYVEGAEPGFILNKLTKRLWGPDDECVVIPCVTQRYVVEWRPRDAGGGYRGRYELTEPTVEATMRKIGGREINDPGDKEGRKKKWVTEEGNDLIDTRYFYVLQVDRGIVTPVVVAFSSTGHTVAKDWMFLQRQPIPGTTTIPPAWSRMYRLRVVATSNNKGDFFKLEAVERGWVADPAVRAMGRALFEAASRGAVSAAAEGPHGADRPTSDVF